MQQTLRSANRPLGELVHVGSSSYSNSPIYIYPGSTAPRVNINNVGANNNLEEYSAKAGMTIIRFNA